MEHEQLLKLLSSTAQENKQAFSRIYQTTSGQLYAVALKMLGQKELAEEALQEAYVRIWHNAAEYQQQRQPNQSGYFSHSATNQV